MNYQIIADEEKLKQFIDWLPELLPHEIFYCSLLARNKYLANRGDLKGDKCSLRRFTSTKQYLLRKIKQLECPLGAYEQDGVPIPQEALALYISLNPVSQIKAAKMQLKWLADVIGEEYRDYNIHQKALSCLQESTGRKLFADIDFDGVTIEEVFPQIDINPECLTFLKTHGGFHCLIEFAKMDKKYEKTWYKNITKIKGADVTKSSLVPVVGTFQGMKIPELITYEQFRTTISR